MRKEPVIGTRIFHHLIPLDSNSRLLHIRQLTIQRHKRVTRRKLCSLFVTAVTQHEAVVGCANNSLTVIKHHPYYLCLSLGHTSINQAFKTDCASFANGVTKVLFSFTLLRYELFEAERPTISLRNKRISRETATRTIAHNKVPFTPIRL